MKNPRQRGEKLRGEGGNPSGACKARGAYLFAMAISWDGLKCGVEALEDDAAVEDELRPTGGTWDMIGW